MVSHLPIKVKVLRGAHTLPLLCPLLASCLPSLPPPLVLSQTSQDAPQISVHLFPHLLVFIQWSPSSRAFPMALLKSARPSQPLPALCYSRVLSPSDTLCLAVYLFILFMVYLSALEQKFHEERAFDCSVHCCVPRLQNSLS